MGFAKVSRLIQRIDFASAGVKDLILRRDPGTDPASHVIYNDKPISQTFRSLLIQNESKELGSYCLEKDLNNNITVDLAIRDTVKIFLAEGDAGAIVEEEKIDPFMRIRIYLDGSGIVALHLYR